MYFFWALPGGGWYFGGDGWCSGRPFDEWASWGSERLFWVAEGLTITCWVVEDSTANLNFDRNCESGHQRRNQIRRYDDFQ